MGLVLLEVSLLGILNESVVFELIVKLGVLDLKKGIVRALRLLE